MKKSIKKRFIKWLIRYCYEHTNLLILPSDCSLFTHRQAIRKKDQAIIDIAVNYTNGHLLDENFNDKRKYILMDFFNLICEEIENLVY